MKKQKILTEKAVNAKIVFRGAVVEIKKLSDQEVELTFPESLNIKELLGYLESFGILKRIFVTPYSELQPEAQTEENVQEKQEKQMKEENIENSEEEVKQENSTETKINNTEELPREENATITKRRTRKSKNN